MIFPLLSPLIVSKLVIMFLFCRININAFYKMRSLGYRVGLKKDFVTVSFLSYLGTMFLSGLWSKVTWMKKAGEAYFGCYIKQGSQVQQS